MSVSLNVNPAVPVSPTRSVVSEPEEVIGFWERAKEGVGWIISPVVWFVSVIGRAVVWPFQIVSGLAFRALGVVWPDAAARAEALWGHLVLVGERVTHAFREESLLSDVQKLHEKNQVLHGQVEHLSIQIHVMQGEKGHLAWERDVAIQDRDQARGEVTEKIIAHAHLLGEKEALSSAKQQLEVNLNEVMAETTLAIAEKNAAIQAKQQQQVEHDQALQQVEVFRAQLEQAGNNEQLLQEFQRIQEAYAEKLAERQDDAPITMTEGELANLIPVFEARRESYQAMIQALLDGLETEDPLRVPLEGIKELFKDESQHLTRVSQAMHFYTGLQELVNQLQDAIQ